MESAGKRTGIKSSKFTADCTEIRKNSCTNMYSLVSAASGAAIIEIGNTIPDKENSEVFDFSLLPEDMEQIDKIERTSGLWFTSG